MSQAIMFIYSTSSRFQHSNFTKFLASSKRSLIFLIICYLFFCESVYGQTRRDSLYRIDDPNIITLDSSNFEQVVNSPKRDYLVMVQFYLHWMEAGKKYADTYIQFAGNVSYWDKIFKVAAINCSPESNTIYCQNGVNSFPTIKLIDPPLSADQNAIESSHTINGLLPVHGLIRSTLDRISDLVDHRKAPKSWPDIRLIKALSLDELLTKIKSQNIPFNATVLVIVEESVDKLTARKTVLDLSSASSDLIVRAVDRAPNLIKELTEKIQGDKPAIVVIPPSQKMEDVKVIGWNQIKTTNLKTRDSLTPYILENYVEKMIKLKPVYMADMYKGLRYSLYKEVLGHQVLNYTKVQALYRYVAAIHRYFPFDNENPRRFFMRMDTWLKMRKPGKDLPNQDLQAIMKAGNEGFIPQIDNYVHCKGEKSGYPCSLWLIFHTLTVSEYDRHMKNDSKAVKYAHQFPSVLYAIRDYVKYFYTCAECVDHFNNMTANLKDELTSANSSVMWLWEAHNKISKRISDQDPFYRKPQFPTRFICPRCFTESGHRNMNETLNFIMDYYRKDKIIKVRSDGYTYKASLITPVIFSFIATIFSSKLSN